MSVVMPPHPAYDEASGNEGVSRTTLTQRKGRPASFASRPTAAASISTARAPLIGGSFELRGSSENEVARSKGVVEAAAEPGGDQTLHLLRELEGCILGAFQADSTGGESERSGFPDQAGIADFGKGSLQGLDRRVELPVERGNYAQLHGRPES